MGLVDIAKADLETITSNSDEWGVSMTFVAPNSKVATVKGLHTKHHMAVDENGEKVNSRQAHVSVSEKFLTDAGYPVRDSNGIVSLRNHKVTVKDSTGNSFTYVIRSWFPDELLGFIVCVLGSYSE